MTFSQPTRNTYKLTPLRAAIVEAMPDKNLVREIKTQFQETRQMSRQRHLFR